MPANGTYSLTNVKAKTLLDLLGPDHSVIGFGYHSGPNQAWIFENIGKHLYLIKSAYGTGQYLGIPGEPCDGQKVAMSPLPFAWRVDVEPNANDMVRLLVPETNFNVILSDNGNLTDGTIIELRAQWEGQSHLWKLDDLQCDRLTGSYSLTNLKGNICLDISRVADNQSNRLVIGFKYHGGLNQGWIFEEAGKNLYFIKSAYDTRQYLALAGAPFNGQKVVPSPSRFLWQVLGIHDAVRVLVPGSNFNIALSDFGNATPGVPIEVCSRWEGQHQLWKLNPQRIRFNGGYILTNVKGGRRFELERYSGSCCGSKGISCQSNQLWFFEEVARDLYLIKSNSSQERYLGLMGKKPGYGQKVVLSPSPFVWRVEHEHGHGAGRLCVPETNFILSDSGGPIMNTSTPFELQARSEAQNQFWMLEDF